MASPKATGAISSSLSKGNSRRTTCDTCRERKVRCNKEHPACERCTRLKLKCEYTPQSESLDVSQALLQLHSRLGNFHGMFLVRPTAEIFQNKQKQNLPHARRPPLSNPKSTLTSQVRLPWQVGTHRMILYSIQTFPYSKETMVFCLKTMEDGKSHYINMKCILLTIDVYQGHVFAGLLSAYY